MVNETSSRRREGVPAVRARAMTVMAAGASLIELAPVVLFRSERPVVALRDAAAAGTYSSGGCYG
jgi:hypothetical protein